MCFGVCGQQIDIWRRQKEGCSTTCVIVYHPSAWRQLETRLTLQTITATSWMILEEDIDGDCQQFDFGQAVRKIYEFKNFITPWNPYMKRAIKYLLFLWLIPVFAYLLFITLSSQANVDDNLVEANGLIWGKGDEQITVHVQQTTSGEQKSYEILLAGNNSLTPDKYVFTLDEDMWGGGFVKAVQADGDPELELIAWGIHEYRDSFLLDHHEGKIRQIPFANTTKDVQSLSVQWRQAHIINGMTLSFFVIFAVVYYIFIGIIVLLIKIIRKVKTKPPPFL
jgi:hypothetical protein